MPAPPVLPLVDHHLLLEPCPQSPSTPSGKPSTHDLDTPPPPLSDFDKLTLNQAERFYSLRPLELAFNPCDRLYCPGDRQGKSRLEEMKRTCLLIKEVVALILRINQGEGNVDKLVLNLERCLVNEPFMNDELREKIENNMMERLYRLFDGHQELAQQLLTIIRSCQVLTQAYEFKSTVLQDDLKRAHAAIKTHVPILYEKLCKIASDFVFDGRSKSVVVFEQFTKGLLFLDRAKRFSSRMSILSPLEGYIAKDFKVLFHVFIHTTKLGDLQQGIMSVMESLRLNQCVMASLRIALNSPSRQQRRTVVSTMESAPEPEHSTTLPTLVQPATDSKPLSYPPFDVLRKAYCLVDDIIHHLAYTPIDLGVFLTDCEDVKEGIFMRGFRLKKIAAHLQPNSLLNQNGSYRVQDLGAIWELIQEDKRKEGRIFNSQADPRESIVLFTRLAREKLVLPLLALISQSKVLMGSRVFGLSMPTDLISKAQESLYSLIPEVSQEITNLLRESKKCQNLQTVKLVFSNAIIFLNRAQRLCGTNSTVLNPIPDEINPLERDAFIAKIFEEVYSSDSNVHQTAINVQRAALNEHSKQLELGAHLAGAKKAGEWTGQSGTPLSSPMQRRLPPLVSPLKDQSNRASPDRLI